MAHLICLEQLIGMGWEGNINSLDTKKPTHVTETVFLILIF